MLRVTTTTPEKVFKPYSVTIEVATQEDHDALNYASMCSTCIPEAVRKKANASSFRHNGRGTEYAAALKTLLVGLRSVTRYKPQD